MKLVHVCLSGSYYDGWGYQENVLAEYNYKSGIDVYVVASQENYQNIHQQDTERVIRYEYNGVKVFRIPFINFLPEKISSKLKVYKGLFKVLMEIDADIIFFHGTIGMALNCIPKYKKKFPAKKIYVDSHADYYNCCQNVISKYFLYRGLWKYLIRRTIPYVEKYYGTLPIRNIFMQEVFRIPERKTHLLIMGVDETVLPQNSEKVRIKIREKYQISNESFVIIAGGKIDANKNFDKLMDAVNGLKNERIVLFIFGNVVENYRKEFEKHMTENIIFAGWMSPNDINECFVASDLGIFPGLHSVLWENACACQLPCIFHKLEGIDHVNVNGNCLLLEEVTTIGIQNAIKELIKNNGEKYMEMKMNAEIAKEKFLYKNIIKDFLG